MKRTYRLVPKSVSRVLLRIQGGLCAGCGQPVRPIYLTADHVIPVSRGGADALGNLVAMHGPCNSRKSNRMPTGCELIWLLAVNARLGVGPQTFRAAA